MEKNKAVEVINQMPENFQVEDLIERLIFIAKVEDGLNDIGQGNVVEHNEVIKQASEWFKK
jgi:predicted transcriptional regulator